VYRTVRWPAMRDSRRFARKMKHSNAKGKKSDFSLRHGACGVELIFHS
jgi:hypothetical protein